MKRTRKRASAHSESSTSRNRTLVFGKHDTVSLAESASRQYETRQETDMFAGMYQAVVELGIMEPPFSPITLKKLPAHHNVLLQCIEAMVTNIAGFGWRLEYVGPDGQMESAEAQDEKERLECLLEQPNDEDDYTEVRKRLQRDMETYGYAFMEVGRDSEGEVSMLFHVPADTVRATWQDRNPTKVEVKLKRGKKSVTQVIRKRFRRFVQLHGRDKVFFKEFGDPRVISPKTGLEDATLSLSESATEILMVRLYATGEVYGWPRWINQLPAIFGSREAEMVNLRFFEDNAIPALAVLISGGSLSKDGEEALREMFQGKGTGRDRMHKAIVLEALPDEESADLEGRVPPAKIELKPLSGDRQGDALFQKYDEENQQKVRSAFRIGNIFVGRSEDYNRATAEAALATAECQVFGPDRAAFDKVMNRRVLAIDGEPPRFWRLRTNPAKIAGGDAVVKSLVDLNTIGAMTPNVAIGIANELFDLKIPTITEEWGDMPYKAGGGVGVDTEFDADGKPIKPVPVLPGKAGKPAGSKEPENTSKAAGQQRVRIRLASGAQAKPSVTPEQAYTSLSKAVEDTIVGRVLEQLVPQILHAMEAKTANKE